MSFKSYAFINRFLAENEYSFDKEEIYLKLHSHPDYPNLTAFSDTIAMLGAESIMAEVPKEFFDQLPEKFISLVIPQNKEPEVVLVHIIGKDNVQVTYPDDSKKTFPTTEFLEQWSEILISVDRNENPNPVLTKKSDNQRQNILAIGVIGLVSLLAFIFGRVSYLNVYSLIYSLLNIVGVFISILLVRESLGMNSGKLSRICHASLQTDCGDIILSKGARLFRGILLSDICLIYFTAMVVVSFGPHLPPSESLLYLGILSIIPCFYSVYYQGVVLKKWCFLCLCIIGVLMLQLITLWLSPVHTESDLFSVSLIVLVIASFGLVWLAIKPSFEKLEKSKYTQLRFHVLKRSISNFNFFLSQKKDLDIEALHQHTIQLGSEAAKTIITAIISPTCSSCKDTYEGSLELIRRHSDIFRLRIVFNVNVDQLDKHTGYIPMIERLHEIYQTEGAQKVIDALNDWYISQIGPEKWHQKWGVNREDHKDLLRKNFRWCQSHDINHAPEVIINKKLIPVGYDVEDFSYFVEFLKPQA